MNTESSIYHIPALLKETVDRLNVRPDGTYVDVTFGGGGHSREILSRLGPEGRLISFDRDLDALVNAPDDPRFTFVHSDYRYLTNFLRYHGLRKVDGIVADLGVSFHHFDTPERGFSFRADAPLDMRMNRAGGATAAEILANADEDTIISFLKTYTDLRRIPDIARAITRARLSAPVDTTFRLAEAVTPMLNPRSVKKDLAQVFQALRIVTNREFESLESLLSQSAGVLKRHGRLAVLTYHSGEDRLVKDLFKTGSIHGADNDSKSLIFGAPASPWRQITRSPLTASEEETARNPRARSAKLRVAEYIG